MTVLEPYVLRVDGNEVVVTGAVQEASLTTALREHLGVLQVKDGCNQGRCGSCVVLLDGVLVTSCTVLAADAVGSEVTTVRSLGSAEQPGRVQRALVEAGAVQCGFCTPGMAVAIADLVAREPAPTETAARLALSGNLCRCTGYGRILDAVARLAAEAP